MRQRGETYIGDAVYASFDGYRIWLRTGDGNNQRIALEPEVNFALTKYAQGCFRMGPNDNPK
jgi:hypothetical protein